MWPRRDPSPTSDLVLMADLDRLARAECYERLRRETENMGELALADIFGGLAQDSFAMLPDERRDAGNALLVGKAHTKDLDLLHNATVGRTAYEAWATAVDIERGAVTKLIALLSRAEDPQIKQTLLERIHQSEDRAADYRVHRRAAYHSEKISAVRAVFPDIRRIQDAGDLALIATAIEKWFLHLLEQISDASTAYHAQLETTRAVVSHLESLTCGREPPRRLSKWLQSLNDLSEEGVEDHRLTRFQHYKMAGDAERIFDYYDRVFEETENEETQALAQWLSIAAIDRLKALRNQAVH